MNGSQGVAVKVNDSGHVFVLTNTSNSSAGDIGILKYSPSGTLLWQVIYEHPNNVNEGGVAMALDNNNNVYVVGDTDSNLNFHIETVKYNSNGVLQWARFYNIGDQNDPNDIIVDKTGNIIIAGSSLTGGITSALTIKYNSNGDTLWARKFNQLSSNNANLQLAIDDSNNVYTVGRAGADYLVLKYSSGGQLMWFATYNSPQNYFDIGWHISIDNNRNIYVVGTTAIPFQATNNTIIRLNSNGVTQWTRIFVGIFGDSGGCQIPQGIVVTPDGSSIYYATYGRNGTGGGGTDIITLKYNSSGDTQWVRRYWGGVNATGNSPSTIKLDKFNNIYVAGTGNYMNTSTDYTIIKYLINGFQQWVTTYNGVLSNGFDNARDFFIDTTLQFYITGNSRNILNNGWETATIKYSQPVGIQNFTNEIPTAFKLEQNYPNPFNNKSKIKFQIAKSSFVKMEIFDVLGREVESLVNEFKDAGFYDVKFDGTRFASGVYFYRIEAGDFVQSKKMILVK